jgi:hypothetical protein
LAREEFRGADGTCLPRPRSGPGPVGRDSKLK